MALAPARLRSLAALAPTAEEERFLELGLFTITINTVATQGQVKVPWHDHKSERVPSCQADTARNGRSQRRNLP